LPPVLALTWQTALDVGRLLRAFPGQGSTGSAICREFATSAHSFAFGLLKNVAYEEKNT